MIVFFLLFFQMNFMHHVHISLPPSKVEPVGNVPPVTTRARAATHIQSVGPRLLALVLVAAAVSDTDGSVSSAEVGGVKRAVGSEGDAVLVEVLTIVKISYLS